MGRWRMPAVWWRRVSVASLDVTVGVAELLGSQSNLLINVAAVCTEK